MLERIIFTALTEGIAEAVADPASLARIFYNLKGLDETETDRIVDLFRRLPPTIYHGYPREESQPPLIAIVLDSEEQSSVFLDDTGGIVAAETAEFYEDNGLEGALMRTSIFTSRYALWVVAASPDICIAYYQVAKHLLARKLTYMKERGVLNCYMSGGDMSPADTYMPTFLFIRKLVLTCQFEEPAFEFPARGTSIRGIHVDDDSSVARMGGVVANVITEDTE